MRKRGRAFMSTAGSFRSGRVAVQLGANIDRVCRIDCAVAFLDVLDLSFFIDDERGAIGKLKLIIQDAVLLGDLARHIAEKRKCDSDLFGECGVGGKSVDADSEYGGVLEVDLTRVDTRLVCLQLFRSTTGESKHVEG